MEREFFSRNAKEEIGRIIREASGNEVFFIGSFGKNGIIENTRVIARGNDYSVPAIVSSAKPGEVVIHNHPSGVLTPSDEDIHMASIFGNSGVGFYIINNDATRVYVVVERFKESEQKKLDTKGLKKFLLPQGEVADVMGSQYEERPEQLKMLETVATAFNENLISLIEAGTGTGKTLAYLIPAASWSLLNGERVVISTKT